MLEILAPMSGGFVLQTDLLAVPKGTWVSLWVQNDHSHNMLE